MTLSDRLGYGALSAAGVSLFLTLGLERPYLGLGAVAVAWVLAMAGYGVRGTRP